MAAKILYQTVEEKRIAHNLANVRYERRNPGRKRDFQWKARGIKCTEELYELLRLKQNGNCAICNRNESEFKYKLSVDHSHRTGKVRGLLCKYCNQVIVFLVEENYEVILKAKEYLEN